MKKRMMFCALMTIQMICSQSFVYADVGPAVDNVFIGGNVIDEDSVGLNRNYEDPSFSKSISVGVGGDGSILINNGNLSIGDLADLDSENLCIGCFSNAGDYSFMDVSTNDYDATVSLENGSALEIYDSLILFGKKGKSTTLTVDHDSEIYAEKIFIGGLENSTGKLVINGKDRSTNLYSDILYVLNAADQGLELNNSNLKVDQTFIGLMDNKEGFIYNPHSTMKVSGNSSLGISAKAKKALRSKGPSGDLNNYGYLSFKNGKATDTLEIAGNYVQGIADSKDNFYQIGNLIVDVDNKGNSDKILIHGEADLQNANLEIVPIEAISGNKKYTVLTASDIYGTFNNVKTSNTAFLKIKSTTYNGNKVVVSVEKGFDFKEHAGKGQSGLASVLDKHSNKGGDLGNVLGKLQTLKTTKEVKKAYSQIMGQTKPSLVQVAAAATGGHMSTVSGRMSSMGSASNGPNFVENFSALYEKYNIADISMSKYNFALGYDKGIAGVQMPFGFWARGYSSSADRETDGLIAGYDSLTKGLALGLDYQINSKALVGISAGYSSADVDYATDDFSDIHSKHYSLYGSYDLSAFMIDAMLTYSNTAYKSYRHISFSGVDRIAKGDYDGEGLSLYLEANKTFKLSDKATLSPMLGFQASNNVNESYEETGADSLNLNVNEDRTESYKVSLGLTYKTLLIENDDFSMDLSLRGRWAYEMGEARSSSLASLNSAPNDTFVIEGAKLNRNTGVLGTGFTMKFQENKELELAYDYALNEDYDNHILSLGLKLRW